MMDEETLSSWIRRLAADESWTSLDPEDVEGYLRLAEPIERAARGEERPAEEADGPGADLVRLLWLKHHPSADGLELCLDRIASSIVPLRFASADALASVVMLAEEDEPLDADALQRLRRTLKARVKREESSIVGFQLRDLLEDVIELQPRVEAEVEREEVRNPYLAGLPIREEKQFFGRQEIFKRIRGALDSGMSSVVLHGARRTGKTSLLYQIQDGRLGDAYVPVYLDLQAQAGVPLTALLQSIVGSIQDALLERDLIRGDAEAPVAPPFEEGAEFAALQEYLSGVFDLLEPRFLVLLFDEYEILQQFLSDEDVARQFQALLERRPGPRAVFAGAQKVEEIQEQGMLFLVDISLYIKISFLSEEESRDLVTVPAEGLLTFDEGVPEAIHAATGGHPFYIQLLCQDLFELRSSAGSVRATDLEEALRRFTHSPSPHAVITWNTLQLNERMVGAAIAELGASSGGGWVEVPRVVEFFKEEKHPLRPRRADVRQAIATLRDIDWVEKEEGGSRYRFTMEVVRRWVAENRSVWDMLRDFWRRADARIARPPRQLAAWALDLAMTLGLYLSFAFGVAAIDRGMDVFDSFVAYVLDTNFMTPARFTYLGVALVMFTLFESFSAASPGMVFCKIRHVATTGLPPTRDQRVLFGLVHTVRAGLWLVLWVAGLSLTLGLVATGALELVNFVMTLRNRKRQGLWAWLFGLITVRERPTT